MPTYRLYRLDGAGRISAAEWIEAGGDDEAMAIARNCPQPRRFELWHRSRLVDRFLGEEE